jgi:murein DD-endopeptidase MepM/ murein hydrolase activator NlpD
VAECPRGQALTITGDDLQAVRRVVFLGRAGRGDDRSARPSTRQTDRIVVAVPQAAHSGPLRLLGDTGSIRTLRLRVRPAAATPAGVPSKVFVDGVRPATFAYPAGAGPRNVQLVRAADGATVAQWPAQDSGGSISFNGVVNGQEQPAGAYAFRVTNPGDPGATAASAAPTFTLLDHIFPIRGRHDLGQSATNNFGGGRGHQGQDMFAACGTPLVAARAGRVLKADYHGRAGNYVVIQQPDGQSTVYMHMRSPALVEQFDQVKTGQPIGEVGDTGRASGCHLHFELWSAPGWYRGGAAVDPLPELRRWDSWS